MIPKLPSSLSEPFFLSGIHRNSGMLIFPCCGCWKALHNDLFLSENVICIILGRKKYSSTTPTVAKGAPNFYKWKVNILFLMGNGQFLRPGGRKIIFNELWSTLFTFLMCPMRKYWHIARSWKSIFCFYWRTWKTNLPPSADQSGFFCHAVDHTLHAELFVMLLFGQAQRHNIFIWQNFAIQYHLFGVIIEISKHDMILLFAWRFLFT